MPMIQPWSWNPHLTPCSHQRQRSDQSIKCERTDCCCSTVQARHVHSAQRPLGGAGGSSGSKTGSDLSKGGRSAVRVLEEGSDQTLDLVVGEGERQWTLALCPPLRRGKGVGVRKDLKHPDTELQRAQDSKYSRVRWLAVRGTPLYTNRLSSLPGRNG